MSKGVSSPGHILAPGLWERTQERSQARGDLSGKTTCRSSWPRSQHEAKPSDRDMPSQRLTRNLQSSLMEIWALTQEICEAAIAACARSIEKRQESAQRRER